MEFCNIFLIYFLIFPIFADFDFEIDEEDSKPEEIGSMQPFENPSFVMGSDDKEYKARGEYPKRWEYTKPFKIDRYPVTVADFQNYVKEQKYYITQADEENFSYVFFRHLKEDVLRMEKKYFVTEPWFIPVIGARWDKPYGSPIDLSTIKYNPVTHVSFADAYRYCQHLKKRLPTEYEWELAARTNNRSWDYPWGPNVRRNRMNIWQGLFPSYDHGYDGYTHVSPVNAFPAQNDLGMYDMLGNVWEWTTTTYLGSDLEPDQERNNWVTLKGGSFLDTYDGAERTSPVRSSIKIGRHYLYTAENVGFRCAESVDTQNKNERKIIRYEDTYDYKMKVEQLAKKFIVLKKKINVTMTRKPKTTLEHVHHFDFRDEL